MKMRKNKHTVIFVLLGMCLCSCNFHFENPTDTAVVTLAVTENSARTIFPEETFSVENYTDFVLTGTRNGTTETLASFSTYSALRVTSIGISAGIWDFALTAKQGNISFSGIIKNKEIVAGTNALSFSLDIIGYGLNGDVGSISFSLKLPTDNAVLSIQAGLFSIDEDEALSGFMAKENSVSSNIFVYNKTNVPVGAYRLKIQLYADTAYTALINTYSELILVATNCKSESVYEMDSLNPVYSITYNLNGGYITSDYILPQSFTRLSHFSLPSAKYIKNTNGDGFVGWYTDETFSSERKFSIDAGTTENITLYANWSDNAIAVDGSELSSLNLSNVEIGRAHV